MKPCKVVPYVANITTKETTATAANKPELLINDFAARGWAFESAEKFETVVDDPGYYYIHKNEVRLADHCIVPASLLNAAVL